MHPSPYHISLIANSSEKCTFVTSNKFTQCIEQLKNPPEGGAAREALQLLALATREPRVAALLQDQVTCEMLDPYLFTARTEVLRLVAAIGCEPTPHMREAMAVIFAGPKPNVQDAQVAAEICRKHNIYFIVEPSLELSPTYLASQLSICDRAHVDTRVLWQCVQHPETTVRLLAAGLLVDTIGEHDSDAMSRLFAYVVNCLPDARACRILAKILSLNYAELAKTLVESVEYENGGRFFDSPEGFALYTSLARSNDLRELLLKHNIVEHALAHIKQCPTEVLDLLRVLGQSIGCLRQGAASQQVAAQILQCIDCEMESVKTAAMAVACNLVLEMSPCSETMFAGGVVESALTGIDSRNRELRVNSIWLLKNAAFDSSNLGYKQLIFKGLGVSRLIELCQCKDPEIETLAMGLLSNLLCGNNDAIDVWLSETPVDLWRLIDMRLYTPHTLNWAIYVMLHIAAGEAHHREAIIDRPALLRKLSVLLEEAPSEETRLAGIWLLCNLFAEHPSPHLILFKQFLHKCMTQAGITVRARAKHLLTLV